MAFLETVNFTPLSVVSSNRVLLWSAHASKSPIPSLPQIFWSSGENWCEANLWALNKIYEAHRELSTVVSLFKHLHAYANFLEEHSLDWRYFPIKRSERAATRFRGHLIKQINEGKLTASTARARINAVIQFYKFASEQKFIDANIKLWQDKVISVNWIDTAGFSRAKTRMSTDLAIPNRVAPGIVLEDGLQPLSDKHMTELLSLTFRAETQEMHLMLSLGFFTGARLGTITSLRIENIEQARPDPYIDGIYLVRIGPGTKVATKFDVSGDLLIPKALFDALKLYAYSASRLKREAKARAADRSLLFITARGNPYSKSAMGVLMSSLRSKGVKSGLKFMFRFKFHETRATYGTWLMKLSLNAAPVGAAIEFVKACMFHKNDSTTFRYVKFLECTKGKQEAARAFHEAFSGLHGRDWNDIIS